MYGVVGVVVGKHAGCGLVVVGSDELLRRTHGRAHRQRTRYVSKGSRNVSHAGEVVVA